MHGVYQYMRMRTSYYIYIYNIIVHINSIA